MKSNESIERCIARYAEAAPEVNYEAIEDGMWVIHDEYDNVENIVVHHEAPLLVFRVKLMECPKKNREDLFRRLLELNATEIPHGAFGLENENVVLIDTLQSENLDQNELNASIDSLILTIGAYHRELSRFRD